MKQLEVNKNHLLHYTMYAGIYLGMFWILKYGIVVFGPSGMAMNAINLFLSVGTPVLLYYYLKRYQISLGEFNLSFWHGVQFSVLLFLFASIFEALIVFLHVKWIDPAYIANYYESMIESAKSMKFAEPFIARIQEQPLPGTFMYVFNNVIMGKVFIGFLLSLAIVPMVIYRNPAKSIN